MKILGFFLGIWMAVVGGLRYVCMRVPLLKELVQARRSSIEASVREIGLGLFFATIPIWLMPIIFLTLLLNAPSAQEQITQTIGRGDLFLYSAALMGPMIYAITKKYLEIDETENADGERSRTRIFGRLRLEFPYGLFFLASSIGICVFSALFYTFIILELEDFGNVELNRGNLDNASVLIFVYSIVCLFLVSVFRAEMEDLSARMPRDERKFLRDWFNR